MAELLGGDVARTGEEYGKTGFEITGDSILFRGLPREQEVWMSHGDQVVEAPPGFSVVGRSPGALVGAMEAPDLGIYSVQFHPEVMHTPRGSEILKTFLYDVCGLAPTWTSHSIIESQVEAIRRQVGDARVICGLSGGVDSAVAAALVAKAVGDQLTCIFVDHGLLRAGEAEQVEETFRSHFDVDLVHVRPPIGSWSCWPVSPTPSRSARSSGDLHSRLRGGGSRRRGRPLRSREPSIRT